MTLPTWTGAFPLTSLSVNLSVPGNAKGAYHIGVPVGPGLPIKPVYAGRSDDDLRGRLLDHASVYGAGYEFGFAVAGSVLQAYQWECEMFHSWSPRNNVVHPAKPAWTNHICPFCFK